ncbi:MAG TPA: homoserine dehydrogenase [Terriglobales bacterium]|nr:homoserine dehydrogenase [Terriglobales bacterium]
MMASPFPTPRPITFPPRAVTVLSANRVCKIAILGFGTVGRSVAKLLTEQAPSQLQLTHIFNRNVERKRVPWVSADVRWTEKVEDVLSSDVDVIVELAGGMDPAGGWVRRALLRGKSVVTANKQLIAAEGPELAILARRQGVRLEFGAAVAGGVPVLCALRPGLSGDRILKLAAILNGTCNYILSSMETRGLPLQSALSEAQERGFAEADPTDDVDGLDARAKLAILIRSGFQVEVHPEQILAGSILDVSCEDFSYARELGCTIRQISRAELKGETLLASVQPALVALGSPLGRAHSNQNVLVTTGKYGGETVLSGAGAGGNPTAVAVVSDLLSVAQDRYAPEPPRSPLLPLPVSAYFHSAHYVRLIVNHQAGALSSIRRLLAQHGISLRAVLHRPPQGGEAQERSYVALVLEECAASALKNVLQDLRQAEFLAKPPLVLPIV